MAFENIKRPFPPGEWRTVNKEKGVSLKLKHQDKALNSQGYIEMILETPGGNLEIDAHLKRGQHDQKTDMYYLEWIIRSAHWVPPKANMTEDEIKKLIREAFEVHGFLFEQKENQHLVINFETINAKGVPSWH